MTCAALMLMITKLTQVLKSPRSVDLDSERIFSTVAARTEQVLEINNLQRSRGTYQTRGITSRTARFQRAQRMEMISQPLIQRIVMSKLRMRTTSASRTTVESQRSTILKPLPPAQLRVLNERIQPLRLYYSICNRMTILNRIIEEEGIISTKDSKGKQTTANPLIRGNLWM